jgi:hypothetical protein
MNRIVPTPPSPWGADFLKRQKLLKEQFSKERLVEHDLSKMLQQMGSNADEVAATLRAAGVQGVRNTVRVLNPIVRYVQNTLRQDHLDADVMTGKTFHTHGVGRQEVALPQAVLDFLDTFNRGNHPDLELPPT